MSFSALEFMLARQRCRQWVPLLSQQFRLRHVYRIIGFNLSAETAGSFYFTLHLTTMSAPFYTSEQLTTPNPKWQELNQRDMPNGSASCVVLRVWEHTSDGADRILLTWGVHFSGLCYLGNKIVDVQPKYFKDFSVIFSMQGGYYTSHKIIKTDLKKTIPFISNANLLDTPEGRVVYKPVAIEVSRQEVQPSYNLEKLRRIQSLQIQIQKKNVEVQNIRDKINELNGFNVSVETEAQSLEPNPAASSSIRYAPQLLTMNSLNKMLKEKPTTLQRQQMITLGKEIARYKFLTRLLSQEKDKMSVINRGRKQMLLKMTEDNDERESNLMEDYRKLSKEAEKLKEFKKLIYQHREMYSNINMHLQNRRRHLLKELLQIFTIEKTAEDQYKILGIYLPMSDVLADCSDTGLSVALGYITHILMMASTFLQLPLRYPLVHYGSRSYIIDNISPTVPDKDRHFPLFTRGKDKVHFTYAVYLLNKDIAQLRWYLNMNTTDLKATLHNLLTFLQGARESKTPSAPPTQDPRSLTAPLSQEVKSPAAPLSQEAKPHTAPLSQEVKSPTAQLPQGANSPTAPLSQTVKSPTAPLTQEVKSHTAAPLPNEVKSPAESLPQEVKSPAAPLPQEVKSPTAPLPQVPPDGKFVVSLQKFGSHSSISDPLLDSIRREKKAERSSSPTGRLTRKAGGTCRNSECGKGLSEILAIPEDYLKRRTSADSFGSYVNAERFRLTHEGGGDCCGPETQPTDTNLIKIADGKEVVQPSNGHNEESNHSNVERGTDVLGSPTKLSHVLSNTLTNFLDRQVLEKTADEKNDRINRSMDSYTEEDDGPMLRTSFEPGTEPSLGMSPEAVREPTPAESLKELMKDIPQFISSEDTLNPDVSPLLLIGGVATDNPLMARTDALLTTKSFNLIRPKQ